MNAGAFLLAAQLVACCGSALAKGYVPWSGIEPHPAVVNPVCAAEAGTVVDLAGEWAFVALEHHADRSQCFCQKQFEASWKGERTIHVPGSWESQGVGDQVKEPLRTCYGGVRKFFPLRHAFVGNGWYRKTVDLPAEWKGRRIWLKVGGVGCQGWFWVNDRPVAHVYDYCATRKYEITDFVTPGKPVKIVASASNAVASKRGTAEAYGTCGGLLRTVEIEATPETFFDDVWVRGLFDEKAAEVHVEIEGPERQGMKVRVAVDGATVEQPLSLIKPVKGPLRDFRPWSPEAPNLYTARVELVSASGNVLQTRDERFGVRKIEVRGKDFYLNGKPFFLRGCGFHEIEPIVGYIPPDRAKCREMVARAREAGFNAARLHTRCPFPEFFEACDELGLMLQPELPYYGDFPEGMNVFEPLEDAEELYLNYRRHPSFAIYCGGNEGTFGPTLGREFYSSIKARDPDRLVIEQDTCAQPSWKRAGKPGDVSKFRVRGIDDYVAYPTKIWQRGSLDPDCPLVCHEYLNLAVKADARLEDDYTGLWDRPVKRADRLAWLRKFGLDEAMGDRLQDAQHALQAVWQKRGIESARKDPCCDGYWYWSLADCVFVNEIGWTGVVDEENFAYMGQGLFDPFLRDKIGGQTAAGFAVFKSPVGVFIDVAQPDLHLVSGGDLRFDVLAANYSENAFSDASVAWRLVAADGSALKEGKAAVADVPIGGVRKLVSVESVVPELSAADAAKLVVELRAGSAVAARNEWDAWLFPRRTVRDGRDIAVVGAARPFFEAAFDGILPASRLAEAKVVVVDCGSPIVSEALARGQSVVEVGGMDGAPNRKLGWWFLDEMVGASFDVESPLLSRLPKSPALSTLHFRMIRKGRKMPVEDFPASNLVAVAEGGRGCWAHLGERVAKSGARHVFIHGLALNPSWPEALALVDGIVDRCR